MIDTETRSRLHGIAIESITHGLQHRRPLRIQSEGLTEMLVERRATFVTLRVQGQLRGCIGQLKPRDPLAQSVAANAFAAAFRDPRFEPLVATELVGLAIQISVLSEPEPLTFESQEELLQQLRPGTDGLILAEGTRTGTFLPSVWSAIPRRQDFIEQLKRKAGLAEDYWSKTLTVARYTTETW